LLYEAGKQKAGLHYGNETAFIIYQENLTMSTISQGKYNKIEYIQISSEYKTAFINLHQIR
jgi:hypothetical protein